MNAENEIRAGRVTEKEFVEMFGSEALKESYKKNGHFIGGNKKTLLSTAARYCHYKKLGLRKYEITDVYKYPLPTNFNKMNNSLYGYIIPLILKRLTSDTYDSKSMASTAVKLAGEIGMLNRNYNLVRYNKLELCEYLQTPPSIVDEFYRRTQRMIEWYITNALNYLETAGLIVWQEIYWVYKEKFGSCEIDENYNIDVGTLNGRHRATKEEIDYYTRCVDIADKKAGISNERERYYSAKSEVFKKALSSELYKKKIRRVYKNLEVYCVNVDRCKYLLGFFKIGDADKFIKKFNNAVTKILTQQADSRYKKYPNKYNIYGSKNDYVSFFKGMCDITIDKDMESLRNILSPKTIQDNYKLKFTHRDLSQANNFSQNKQSAGNNVLEK